MLSPSFAYYEPITWAGLALFAGRIGLAEISFSPVQSRFGRRMHRRFECFSSMAFREKFHSWPVQIWPENASRIRAFSGTSFRRPLRFGGEMHWRIYMFMHQRETSRCINLSRTRFFFACVKHTILHLSKWASPSRVIGSVDSLPSTWSFLGESRESPGNNRVGGYPFD